MHTHTCMHEHVNVLTPSFWLVARVPTPLRSPIPSMLHSLWWAVCVALFLLLAFYIVKCTYTQIQIKLSFPCVLYPPQLRCSPHIHTSKILCRYLCMYGCMCVYVCVCNHNSRCGVINQRKMQYKRIARSLRQSSPKVQKYI